jgi:hypothetical protein
MRVKISYEKNWWEKKWWVSMYRERQIKKEKKEVVLSGEFGCTTYLTNRNNVLTSNMWPNKEGQKAQNELVSICKHSATTSKTINTLS